ILLLAPEYFSPIKEVGSDFHATLDGQVAMGDIDKIIAEDEKSETADQATSFAWTPSSQITLKDINVGDKDSLKSKNINFSWQGTGMIGIIGESGAGKSTLINLLASFLSPTSGEFKIDDKDVNTMENDWLKNIAYI